MKIYFKGDCIVRKEHFGSLVLLGNGNRFMINNKYFDVLKFIDGKNKEEILLKFPNIKKEQLDKFINNGCKKGFLSTQKSNNNKIKFIENTYISDDCLSYPRTVYRESTRLCNYNCIHCYSSSGKINDYKEVPLDIIKTLVDEMVKYGTEFFNIGGGEPLMCSYLYDLLAYCNSKDLTIEITSNGSLITDKNIDKLKESGLKYIQISLDGSNSNIYNKIRINGNFQKVIENISKLVKNFTVSICTVVNQINYNDIINIISLCESLGVKYYRIIPLMEIGKSYKRNDLQLSKNQFQDLYKVLKQEIPKRKKMKISLNENLIIPEIKNITWMPANHYGCSAGRTTCGIDAYGNIYPCSYMLFKELKCGNIINNSLLDIWQNSKVMKQIREVSNLKGKCKSCNYLSLCRGGCRASAFIKNKELNDMDYLCSIF